MQCHVRDWMTQVVMLVSLRPEEAAESAYRDMFIAFLKIFGLEKR